ncbi:MAG TPA: MBL fold metallo-hydrolase, partial [Actinomycetota bacterium]
FGGDTLFQGGPGATAFQYGDFEVIITSIREQLLVLPMQTHVYTGHGPSTTIGEEAPHLDEWIARGY